MKPQSVTKSFEKGKAMSRVKAYAYIKLLGAENKSEEKRGAALEGNGWNN
jgi:hypothetical protein